MLTVNSRVRLSASYLKAHKMENTGFARKVGTVLSVQNVQNSQFVWVGWKLTGEGFIVRDGRPSPLDIVND